jgi:hypothetical protein
MKQINKDMPQQSKKELALELKEAFYTVSPFIEKHTEIVCPDCTNLCCKDKHGRYDENDLLFLTALEVKIPADQPGLEESDPCRYKGCSLERWERPFRCTHFFCNPLLKSLENDNAKLYRAFIDYLQCLVSLRGEFLE